MLPPAEESVIVEAEQKLGFPLPQPLRLIYSAFGGQEYISPGTTGIFGAHRLLSPQEVVSNYEMYQEAEAGAQELFAYLDEIEHPIAKGSQVADGVSEGDPKPWHPGLGPFASWDAYC